MAQARTAQTTPLSHSTLVEEDNSLFHPMHHQTPSPDYARFYPRLNSWMPQSSSPPLPSSHFQLHSPNSFPSNEASPVHSLAKTLTDISQRLATLEDSVTHSRGSTVSPLPIPPAPPLERRTLQPTLDAQPRPAAGSDAQTAAAVETVQRGWRCHAARKALGQLQLQETRGGDMLQRVPSTSPQRPASRDHELADWLEKLGVRLRGRVHVRPKKRALFFPTCPFRRSRAQVQHLQESLERLKRDMDEPISSDATEEVRAH
jgi:hypothetical protein